MTLTIVSLVLPLLVLAAPPAAKIPEPRPEELEIDVRHLAGSVYMLRSNTRIGNPTTVASIGPDGMLIVDPNLDRVASTLLPALRRIRDVPVRFVTATHFHADHTENFELFAREAPGAVAFVPHGQRARLAADPVVHDERPLAPAALPVMSFEGSITLRLNGETVDVLTLPARRGHTDGDEVVWFHEARVLYVGDYLFLDKFPIVDESGDLDGYLDNIAWLLRTYPADAIVVPGHGRFRPSPVEATDMATFAWDYHLLCDSVDAIRAALVAGASADDIVKRGLGDPVRCWSDRPRYVTEERWIRYVVKASSP